MANDEAGAEGAQDLPGQDVPQDERGHIVVPTITPGTEFRDFSPVEEPARGVLQEARTISLVESPKTPSQEPRDQLDDTQMSPARRTVTDDVTNDTRLPTPKRTRTAPMERASRPRPVPRRSTFRNGFNRTRTKTNLNDGTHGLFEYKFGDVSSDSDSSLSSDEEEGGLAKDLQLPQTVQEEEQEDDEAKEEPVAQSQAQADSRPERSYSRFAIGNDWFRTKGRVSRRDGRLKISINETANSGYLAKALGQSIRNHLDIPVRDKGKKDRPQSKKKREEKLDEKKSHESSAYERLPRPHLNIVIMVIGSRGDIQPFLKIGKILKQEYGHRVRIASHPTFRDFVQDADLEFFSVGGDPSELMAFMVKNPGLIPNMQTVREGEISRRRASMAEMFEGFWRACINTSDNENDKENLKLMGEKEPFIADAIIANPPSMAHVHIAEKLGIPLHMTFTFPWSPTTQFPHPLANIKMKKSNVDENYVNFMSYSLVELLTWQGLGDIVNRFRENTLRLEPVSSLWAPGALYRMKVPYTYLWSPSLVPKPRDWGPEIDVAGFVFLDLASKFQPSKELNDFLEDGEPPVYIGFGSIVVDDPDKFTKMIFKAVEMAGVRALVNKGWGGFGANNANTPKNIFMLGNTPHDWLFPRVKAVVHHGGAGTTAIGLKCGKPTMIVPFFGDQPFWGAMVAEAKAGAHECIPYKKLTAERFAEGIKQCLTAEAQKNVQKIADSIAKEGDGAENAVISFHRSLPLAGRKNMRCSVLQERVAVWKVQKSSLRLSALAAEILVREDKLKWSDLKLARHYEWNDFDGPGEPITGSVGALTDSLYGIGEGFGMVPIRIARHIRKREEHERRKRERQKRKQQREQKKAEQAASKSADPNETNSPDVEKPAHVYEDDGRPHTRRENTSTTLASTASADPKEPLPMEVIDDLNWGLKRAGAAILTMPNDLHVAIAQGLHNAPRLYGDATVRKPIRITGVKSGFTAARKEFAYGVYDAWTGLVKQPKGDWEDGETLPAKFAGLGTGIGKGLGGFVLKNSNAVWAPPAFVIKGLIKYIEKRHDGPGSKTFIRRAQMIQGEKDLRVLKARDDEEGKEHLDHIHERVQHGWNVYSEIWYEAHREFGPVGGNLVGKYRLKKEKREWDVNGALENVETISRALSARRSGTAREYFERRKREQRDAELPRESAMDNPRASVEVPVDQGADVRGAVERQESEVTVGNDEPRVFPEELSESTVVETPEESEKKPSADVLVQKPPPMNGSALPVRSHAATVA